MYSIGEIIDKLIIENIKLYNIREQLSRCSLSVTNGAEEAVRLNEQMTVLNANRNKLVGFLDQKLDGIISGEEKNVILEKIRTI